jgi:hypothetical protein
VDGPAVTPGPPDGGAAASSLLDRIANAVHAQVPVVNSVTAPMAVQPLDSGEGRRRRKARRAAARERRRRGLHPEKYRVEFAAWVGIPWRDRPIEARLADFAGATANAITRSAAWRHPLWENHRLLLDPAREAAEIAIGAYRVYCARRDLAAHAPPRSGEQSANDVALGAVRTGYQEKQAALDTAWQALVRRLAALDSYRQHLAEIGPVLAAADAATYLDGAHLGELIARVVTGGAGDDLVAADTERLAYEAEALARVLTQPPLGGPTPPPDTANPAVPPVTESSE